MSLLLSDCKRTEVVLINSETLFIHEVRRLGEAHRGNNLRGVVVGLALLLLFLLLDLVHWVYVLRYFVTLVLVLGYW